MLEKPDIDEEGIASHLAGDFGVNPVGISFLPLGADVNTAVYRIETGKGLSYFLKLRQGAFNETSVTLPRFLADQGIRQIIPPLPAGGEQFWGVFGPYKTLLYPYIEGRNGYEIQIAEQQWADLGQGLRRIHSTPVPPAITGGLRRERYSDVHRIAVDGYLTQVEDGITGDEYTQALAAYLNTWRSTILQLIVRAGQLATLLQTAPLEPVVCHSDLHAGNILIGTGGALYLVDWDEPILAPRERDLMYIGGGLLASGRLPAEEEALFYRAYGHRPVNHLALAYYRYERIIQDISAYCEQLLLSTDGGSDRQQSLLYLQSNFAPGGTIATAYQADKNHNGFIWPSD